MMARRKGPLLLLFLLMATVSMAVIPKTMSYQGSLTDSSGVAIPDAGYDMRFGIYSWDTGGTLYWQETQSGVQVTGGLFSVELGSNTFFPDDLFNNTLLYLEVEVDLNGNATFETDEKYTPRQRITWSAFARNADALNGLDSASFLRSNEDDVATSHITFADGLSWGAMTSYYNVLAADFVAEVDGYQYTQGSNALFKDPGAGTQTWRAAVHLPQGATVTAFKIWFYDNDAADLTVQLTRRNMDNTVPVLMAICNSSGTPGSSTEEDTSISNATVDNSLYSYYSAIVFPAADTSSNLVFYTALITYTTTGP